MITSEIRLPATAEGLSANQLLALRRQVEEADAILREEGAKIKGHTVKAEWTQDVPYPLSERVQLQLQLGKPIIRNTFWVSELSKPEGVRKRIQDELWTVVTAYALNNQDEILQLLEEIKREPAPVGA